MQYAWHSLHKVAYSSPYPDTHLSKNVTTFRFHAEHNICDWSAW